MGEMYRSFSTKHLAHISILLISVVVIFREKNQLEPPRVEGKGEVPRPQLCPLLVDNADIVVKLGLGFSCGQRWSLHTYFS